MTRTTSTPPQEHTRRRVVAVATAAGGERRMSSRESVRALWAYSFVATMTLLVLLTAGAAMFERREAFGMMMRLFFAYTGANGALAVFYFGSKWNLVLRRGDRDRR